MGASGASLCHELIATTDIAHRSFLVLQGWHPFDDWVQFTKKTCLNSLPVSLKTTHFGHVKSDNLTGCRHQGHPTHHVTSGTNDRMIWRSSPKMPLPSAWLCLERARIGVFFFGRKEPGGALLHSWQWRWNPTILGLRKMLLQTCDFQAVPFHFLGGVTSGRYERQGSRSQGIAAIDWGYLCRWQVVGGG